MKLSRRELPNRSKGAYRARVLKWLMSVAFISLLTCSVGMFHLLVQSFSHSSFRGDGHGFHEARVLEEQIPMSRPPRIQTFVEKEVPLAEINLERSVEGDRKRSVDGSGAAHQEQPGAVDQASHVVSSSASTGSATTSSTFDSEKLYLLTIGESHYCVVPRACRSYDGKWSLPKWLAAHASLLSKCGYSLLDTTYYSDEPKSGGVTESQDLFGTKFLRYHFPHFMQDAFQVVTLFNLAFNASGQHVTSARCVTPAGTECPDGAFPPPAGWRPVVPLEDRVQQQEESSWVRSFLRLLPNRDDLGPAQAYMEKLYPLKDQSPPACFRNVVDGVAIMRSKTLPPQLAPTNNILFSANRITKTKRTECPLQIRVLDRDHGASPTTGRFLPEVKELETALQSEADNRGLAVDIKTTTFETFSFEEQVRWMNEADLLISVHGAELTNIVWMRPDAKVLEIMPFLYDTDIFVEVANFVQVQVEQTIAKPDVERFQNCLRKYNEKDGMEGSLRAVDEFRAAGDTFLATGQPGLFDAKGQDVKMLQPCLRAQSLRVDNSYFARRAIAKLDLRCLA